MPITERKVLVYAVRGERVLVFDEPTHPDEGPQVPGGSIEPRESPREAAAREFLEETGRKAGRFVALPVREHRFARGGRTHRHLRHAFAFRAPTHWPRGWDWWETSPHGGGAPILFRFRWMPLARARHALVAGTGLPLADGLP